MRSDLPLKTTGLFLGILLLASCRTMGGGQDAPPLVKLRAGVAPPAATAQLTGTLIRQGDCLAIDGNGTTVIIWARGADARPDRVGINTVVIWPRSATPQSRDGTINGVAIWPRRIGTGVPVLVGERVELDGDMKDDISGLALDRPAPRGCRSGRAFVVRDFRPAPAEAR